MSLTGGSISRALKLVWATVNDIHVLVLGEEEGGWIQTSLSHFSAYAWVTPA